MTLDEIVNAVKRGEAIEYNAADAYSVRQVWKSWEGTWWNKDTLFRIAQKKEMTLVEKLRTVMPDGMTFELRNQAADRIEELEAEDEWSWSGVTTDELLDELKRRVR
jgi:hypothetical protein